MITLRSYAQNEAFNKLVTKKEALLAAKPRFGKTYVGAKIASDGWQSNIVLVLCGINVRNEWREALEDSTYFDYIVTTNEELNNFPFELVNTSQHFAFVVSTQKAGRDIYDEENFVGSNKKLIDFFNSCEGTKSLIFDECHFAEQTARSKKIVDELHSDRRLYLSGTPYTSSIQNRFDKENTFTYTYRQEMQDYAEGKLSYTPVKMRMFILDKYISFEDSINEDWDGLFSDPASSKWFMEKVITFLKEQGTNNHLIFVTTTKQARKAVQVLEKFQRNYHVNVLSAAGNDNRVDSEEATKFFESHPDDLNFIVTCDRLGTGCTIKPLQSVIFCCPTRSAIDFIQKSMRACSDWEGHNKLFSNVICFNKFNSFKVYNTVVNLEMNDKQLGQAKLADFEEMTKAFPIYVQEDLGLKEVSYLDITDIDNIYIQGKTRLFDEFYDINEFSEYFNIMLYDLARQVNSLTGKSKEEKEKMLKKLTDLINSGRQEDAIKALNEELVKNGKSPIELEEADVEQARKALENAFIAIIERLTAFMKIKLENDKIDLLLPEDKLEKLIVEQNGFVSVYAFLDLATQCMNYTNMIYKHVKTNMGLEIS